MLALAAKRVEVEEESVSMVKCFKITWHTDPGGSGGGELSGEGGRVGSRRVGRS